MVLRDSFLASDKVKIIMLACVCPGSSSSDHTLNTLRYAERLKERNPAHQQMVEQQRRMLEEQSQPNFRRSQTTNETHSGLQTQPRPRNNTMVHRANQPAGARGPAFRQNSAAAGPAGKNFNFAAQPEMLSDLEEDKMDLEEMVEDQEAMDLMQASQNNQMRQNKQI